MNVAIFILVICASLLMGFYFGRWYQSEQDLMLLHKLNDDIEQMVQSYIDMVHRLTYGEFGHTPQDIETVCIQPEKIERNQAS